MFASTFREELAKRQGHAAIVRVFNYSGLGILALVSNDFITLVESDGYGPYETQNIPIETIQSIRFPAYPV
ncbi:hypothetical protein [Priestia megaterium]|uniref:hypothetical protein n=1 Tax=Priestia megaterium TaxID=1404 RepID=UPI00207A9923|nr:hypothetical protein [Priestia megaterium]USL45771.1 hypothetical protein LIS78_30230 [Priestia megaterium]